MADKSLENTMQEKHKRIKKVIHTIERFDMNQADLVHCIDALLKAVWPDLEKLDLLPTDVDRAALNHPVNFLLDCLQEKVVSAIEAKSDDNFWAYAKKNGVVFHKRAANDFLTPDESQGGIRANEGNGGEYMPAEEEGRTRMVLAALLAMKALGTIKGNIEVTPGGEIREGAVPKKPYNMIAYQAADSTPVQLFFCDEQEQAAYGLRDDNCLDPEEFLNSSDPVSKLFLRSRGGVQIIFNKQLCNKLQKFTEGLIKGTSKITTQDITSDYLREIVEVYREMYPGENPTEDSGDIYVRDDNVGYVANGDTFGAVRTSMRQGNRGWPKDSPIKSLAQWLDENGYRDKQITDAYLHEIVGVYSERNQGENPTKTSGGDIYVRDGRGGYFANGDTFEKVNASMRRGYRGWKDSPIKGLSQWLDKNGYRDNQITEAYLHEIVGVYREMHPGKNPTQNSDAIYVRDGNGGYVTNGDKFINVDMSIRNKGRGWPKDSPIKSLSQWLKNNGYKPSKESETDLVANQVALQILLTR